MTYSDKLKDPRWQKKRLQVLDRDDFKCTLCGDKKETLHVHHKSYHKSGNPWDTELENLSSLCATCHNVFEKLKSTLIGEVVSIIKLPDNSANKKIIIVIQLINEEYFPSIFSFTEDSVLIYYTTLEEKWVFAIASQLIQLKTNG